MTFVGTAPPKEIEQTSNTDGQVKVTGFVEDIRPYIHGAAVIVVPIRIGSGTRLKILDAMAMGKAIVSTSVGSEGLNVSHRKDILLADNPQDFAQQVTNLLRNPRMRMTLEANATELAQSYDWNLIKERQDFVYREVLKKGGS
jgi:glycosyltransferase involved in cell wall biosynthesis